MPIPKLKALEANNPALDFSELLLKLEINLNKDYKKPPVCIEIKQDINYRFGTYGNFSVIGGKSKAGKTYVISSICAAAISGKRFLNFQTYFEGKEIVVFDTEQGDYDAYSTYYRAIRINAYSKQPENFKIFALRQLDTFDRVSFINEYFETHNNIGLVIIDGIRDLLIDINNTTESNEIVTKLMQWSKIYNFHICVVLHENPGSDKLRGHLGSEVSNKAEMVVSIELEEDKRYSTIKCRYGRGTKAFNDFTFILTEDGLPELRFKEAEDIF